MDLLNDNECTRSVAKSSSTKAWRIFIRAREVAMMTTCTEILCHSSGGPRSTKMLHDRIAWVNHSYVATRAERIQNSKHLILKLSQDGAQPPWNQRPDFARAKREFKRLHDEHMANTQQKYRTVPRKQQVRQRKVQASVWIEEKTAQSTLEQAGGPLKSRGETCRQLRPRQQIGIETIGRRAVGIPSIHHGLTIGDFFSELGPVSVDWRRTARQPTGSVNRTPNQTARADAHTVCHNSYWTEWSHVITRTRVAHGLHIFVSQSSCHTRVMSRS